MPRSTVKNSSHLSRMLLLVVTCAAYVLAYYSFFVSHVHVVNEGYTFSFHPLIFCINTIALLCCCAAMPQRLVSPVDVLIFFFFYSMLFSTSMQFSLVDTTLIIQHELFFLVVILCFLSFVWIRKKPILALKRVNFGITNKSAVKLIFIFATIFFSYLLVKYQAVASIHFFNSSQLYAVRSQFKNLFGHDYSFSLLYSLTVHIFLPLLFICSLWFKKRTPLFLTAICALLLFLMSGLKGILVILVMAGGVAICYKRYNCIPTYMAMLIIFLLILVSFVAPDKYNYLILLRLFSTPGQQSSMYLTFYHHYCNTILNPPSLILSQWNNLPYIVSSKYQLNGTDSVANYLAFALARFGFIGIVFVQVIVLLYIWIYQSIFMRFQIEFHRCLSVALILPILEMLFNTSLFTVLLSGGGAGLIALLYLLMHSDVKLKHERTSVV